MQTKQEIALKYVEKYLPRKGIGKQTIAKMLCKDYPQEFYNVEQARTMVRAVTGAKGKRERDILHRNHEVDPEQQYEPIDFPKTLAEDSKFDDYYLKDVSRMLILSDVHVPYQDDLAWSVALRYMDDHKNKIDTVLLNGDFLDFYQLGYWTRDPAKMRFKGELEIGKEFLQKLRKRYPNHRIIYKEGNHEERLKMYLWRNAPEISELDNLHFEEIVELARNGIEYIGNKRTIRYGNLSILHGHEYRRSLYNPVNSARGIFLKAIANTLIGHFHNSSFHPAKTLDGRRIGCWSTGCLCSLKPDYDPKCTWNHGFADVSIESNGNFSVRNFQILNGKVV